MRLEEILNGIIVIETKGDIAKEITGIHIDSRKIESGNLFVAVKGTQTDGHTYIGKAIEKGASAIVCETFPENMEEDVAYIRVEDTEDCIGRLATLFYDNPTSQLDLIGVTGTNGKTTIATLLYNMFRKFGYKVGLYATISTVKLSLLNIRLQTLLH